MAVLDAAELVHDLRRGGAVGHGERDHTPQGVREGRRRASGLAEDHEALAWAKLVVVHSDVHLAVASLELLRDARKRAWTAVASLGQRDVLDLYLGFWRSRQGR